MPTVIIEHSDLARADLAAVVLRDFGHRLRIIRAHHGDAIPDDLDGVDAILAFGGPQAPDGDGEPWMEAELELLRAANAYTIPIVGICLGSQILARALGGEVGRLDGIDVGWKEVSLTPVGREDPLFAGQPWTSRQLAWHRCHVTTVPEGGRVLASSARTPAEAWAVGLRTYGFQYHPEAYPETLASWIDDDPDALREGGTTREQLDRDTETCYPTSARLARRLFEAMALMLMPLDRRVAGVTRDLHH